MTNKYKNLSDEELHDLIERRYGEDWDFKDLEEDPDLAHEFEDRVTIAT